MPDLATIDSAWKVQKRSHQLSRRYDFDEYDDMRDFLDLLETLSEKEAYYPDLTFSRTHVNVSIKSRADELAGVDYEFAKLVDDLAHSLNNDSE